MSSTTGHATFEAEPPASWEGVVREADLVVVLGSGAKVESAGATPVEVWETDEPSTRGPERMALVRGDIAVRVAELAQRLAAPA